MVSSLARFYYYQELAEQCIFVKMAKMDLKKCRTTANHGLNQEYYYLQSILVALGNISKMLWPVKKENNIRGEGLRTALNIKDDSALKSRDLRNLFEHFDERMDEWFEAEERSGFSDRNVGLVKGVALPPGQEQLRTFDPETWTLTCFKKKYELGPAIEAANGLYEVIQSRIGQPGQTIGPLPKS